jgi:hypothetical protein
VEIRSGVCVLLPNRSGGKAVRGGRRRHFARIRQKSFLLCPVGHHDLHLVRRQCVYLVDLFRAFPSGDPARRIVGSVLQPEQVFHAQVLGLPEAPGAGGLAADSGEVPQAGVVDAHLLDDVAQSLRWQGQL